MLNALDAGHNWKQTHQLGAADLSLQQHKQCRTRRTKAFAATLLPDSDALAVGRAALGAELLQHLAGIRRRPGLQPAVHILPANVEAPRAWHTLTAGVAEQGGRALRASLSPRTHRIPSFHTLAHCACQLTSSPIGRRFRAKPINLFLALLFEQIPAAMAVAGLPPITLDRFDLHHGHLFWAASIGQLGVLLHAKEYPAACTEQFDVHLGNCQVGSTLAFDSRAMDHRNLLWVGGRLACLDLGSPPLQPLLMDGLQLPRTVLESDLGLPLADVNYFAQLSGRKQAERLFVCVPGE